MNRIEHKFILHGFAVMKMLCDSQCLD